MIIHILDISELCYARFVKKFCERQWSFTYEGQFLNMMSFLNVITDRTCCNLFHYSNSCVEETWTRLSLDKMLVTQ